MKQTEIDQISNAFLDAWKEFAGTEMFLVKYLPEQTPYTDLYRESKVKTYDIDNKISFYGSIKFNPTVEEKEELGVTKNITAIITLVTKNLRDNGVTSIDLNDIIEYTNDIGITLKFNIVTEVPNVQFSNTFIFTKLGVVDND